MGFKFSKFKLFKKIRKILNKKTIKEIEAQII